MSGARSESARAFTICAWAESSWRSPPRQLAAARIIGICSNGHRTMKARGAAWRRRAASVQARGTLILFFRIDGTLGLRFRRATPRGSASRTGSGSQIWLQGIEIAQNGLANGGRPRSRARRRTIDQLSSRYTRRALSWNKARFSSVDASETMRLKAFHSVA